jgi:hypothetical protein
MARRKASLSSFTAASRICGNRITTGVEMPRSATSSMTALRSTKRWFSRVGWTRRFPSSETEKKPLLQFSMP